MVVYHGIAAICQFILAHFDMIVVLCFVVDMV